MAASTPVRIGVVGLGTIGRIHATRFDRLGCDLLGADLDEEAREGFTIEFDAPTYADHRELLDADVDAVIVGVPNRFHEGIAIDALEAGVDVLIEKPLAHSVESAERIAEAAGDAEGFCAVGFTMRHASLTRRVRKFYQEGRFGRISHIGVEYLRRDFVPGEGRGWFTNQELAGGGVLMDLGVHIIDLALYLLEYPTVTEVSGVTRSEFGEYAVDDSATALLRCGDGRTISIDTSWKAAVEPARKCAVRGTEAGAAFDISGSELTLVSPEENEEVETVAVETEDMHLVEDRAFLEAVAGEHDEMSDTVEEALVVQRIIEAIYESTRRGEAVQIETP